MVLDTLDIKGLMADPHDFTIFSPSSDLKAVRQAFTFNGEGMVTGYGEGIGQPLENAGAIVEYWGHLAMHHLFSMDDFPAKDGTD